ncbi:MAG TPA: DUF4097 family beta strand repeat-containing protein [Rhodothermales bacterium]|nr:DUF4097 family beta strand repeat-containing protein [Rhodothermales bacterium]
MQAYKSLLLIAVLSPAALLLGGCRGDNVNRTDEGTLVLGGTEVTETLTRGVDPGSRTLVLNGFNGTIQLEGTDAGAASLQFTKKARGSDNDAARQNLAEIAIDESGDNLSYTYAMHSESPERTSVDVSGTVPYGTNLSIQLRNGDVQISSVTGPITVRNENGSIRISGAASNVQAVTQNGSVEAAFQELPPDASVRLSTSSGTVSFAPPAGASALIQASTEAGNIRVADGLQFTSQSLKPEGAGGEFIGKLGAGNADVTLSTNAGQIVLEQGAVKG